MNIILFFLLLILPFYNSYALLKDGDIIDLVCISSPYNTEHISHIENIIKDLGFIPRTKYAEQYITDLYYTNREEKRSRNLIEALNDNDSKAILMIRGGGGAVDLLPFLAQQKKPQKIKPIIGFSDITSIHTFITQKWGWKAIHGVTASYNSEMSQITKDLTNSKSSLKQIFSFLTDPSRIMTYENIIPLNKAAKEVRILKSKLTGGNMTLVSSLIGTDYQLQAKNKILILEDVGVTYHQLDRALHQYLYSNILNGADAIIMGQFFAKSATPQDRLIFKETIRKFANKTKVPVFYWPFFGHGIYNYPLPLNTKVVLEYDAVDKDDFNLIVSYDD